MSEFYKAKVKAAMAKHHQRLAKVNKPKRTNAKPERALQKEMLDWLNARGVFAFPLESKAVYSHAAGRYLNSQTITGASDILGVTPQGFFLAVEVKAPGRRSTLRDAQRIFLGHVLSRGGFAVCSDSIEHLDKIFHSWLNADPSSRIPLLKNDLPSETKSQALCEDLFGVNE